MAPTRNNFIRIAAFTAFLFLNACTNSTSTPRTTENSPQPELTESAVTNVPTLTATLPVPKTLNICTAKEPASLFPLGDSTFASRAISEAIYDGPLDVVQYSINPVILSKNPSLADGDVFFEKVAVKSGELMVAKNNLLVNLTEGVEYFPSGCTTQDCALAYTGNEPVEIDQMVVRYDLSPNLVWSDSTPLTAEDSVYAFQVAQGLFPRFKADQIQYTQAYHSTSPTTVEWRGVPGFRSSQVANFFFTPMPHHVWEEIQPEELLTSDVSSRFPLGYGAYQIAEWDPGSHISLIPNPNYFRAEESLPGFGHLIFWFITNADQAVEMLLDGTCDILDESYNLEWQSTQLIDLHQSGKLTIRVKEGNAWEQISMGLLPFVGEESLLESKQLRQAIAACIDRQSIVDSVFSGQVPVSNSYLLPNHPFTENQPTAFDYDPQASTLALDTLGWIDQDSDPFTPRVAAGVEGVQDGTQLVINYLIQDEQLSLRVAEMVKQSMAKCGIGLELTALPQQEILAPGPEGLLFGRQFQLAQFSWAPSLEPSCFLYLSSEIPGPYPDFPKGWGGANAGGYSNPLFDSACQRALSSLPEQASHTEAHRAALSIAVEDVAFIPLFFHRQVLITRPDFCGLVLDPSTSSSMWNIEEFGYGDSCK